MAEDIIAAITELSGNVTVSFESNEYIGSEDNEEQKKTAEVNQPTETVDSTEQAKIEKNIDENTETEESVLSGTTESVDNSFIIPDYDKVNVKMNNIGVIYEEAGEYDNVMTVKDDSGNENKYDLHIVVLELPVINNATDIIAQKGSTIDYLYNITATDSDGKDITDKMVVDSSAVDTNNTGDYDVTYTVEDENGLTATATIKVTIVEDLYGAIENEQDESKRVASANGTGAVASVRQELAEQIAKEKEQEGVQAAERTEPKPQSNNNQQSEPDVTPEPEQQAQQNIGPHSLNKGSSTNGALNGEQKAYIDSLVQNWIASGSSDDDLSNTLASYLVDNGIDVSICVAEGHCGILVNDWDAATQKNGSTGGIYNSFYISTEGNYENGKLRCYIWSVDIL